MPFKAKPIGSALGGEFTMFRPLDDTGPEDSGQMSWTGPRLKYIPSSWTFSHPPLDSHLKRLIESTWKHAQPKEGLSRTTAPIGGHRGTTWLVPTFHSAPPVQYEQNPKLKGYVDFQRDAPHLLSVVPEDWKLMKDIPRVSAYAFRGDSRSPDGIKAAGGFQPPFSRSDDYYIKKVIYPTFGQYLLTKLNVHISLQDFERLLKQAMPDPVDRLYFSYYSMWRSQVQGESMHLGRMLAVEDLKGYISTTKATSVAKGFAKVDGFVYLLRVRGGFHLPAKGHHAWTTIFGEEEIAVPNSLSWHEVFGWREVGTGKKFTGPIHLRTGFDSTDERAFELSYRLLSGIKQPMAR